ncbi:MAG: hypothetical protein ACRDVW_04060 [Acidimicrobiales bacterium]
MTETKICAAPECTKEVPERIGRGRPFTYCSPQCRPTPVKGHRQPLIVEIDHEPTEADERPLGRVWSVLLRRGPRHVVIAAELGRPSAENLAADISWLLGDLPVTTGGAID